MQMKYHFKYLIFILFLVASSSSIGAERLDLYDLGKKAYENGNCTQAIMNLYAFIVINEENIVGANNQKVKADIENKINHCEVFLNNSVAKSKGGSHKGGISGKADQF